MGLASPIRSINNWFARVVYERGRFDSELETHAEGGYYLKRFIAQIARFFIWLSRKILWLLMQAPLQVTGALGFPLAPDGVRCRPLQRPGRREAGDGGDGQLVVRRGHVPALGR